MTDGEYLMDYDELLERSKSSKIEKALLNALYPELGPNGHTKEITGATSSLTIYDMPVTLPDFAFPSLQIAIYCDGYEFHSEYEIHSRRIRQQSRDLQLQWLVRPTLRGAGNPERAGRGSSHDRASDTAGEATETSHPRLF